LFNDFEIPVVNVSHGRRLSPESMINLEKTMAKFRTEGCLAIGTGTITHNLQLFFQSFNKGGKV
jgi:aromatic ring-opening dioxygenase catalytic subunit (LigB family)